MKHVPQTVYKSHQAQLMGWICVMIFTQIIHSWINARKRGAKNIVNIFQRALAFGLDNCQF